MQSFINKPWQRMQGVRYRPLVEINSEKDVVRLADYDTWEEKRGDWLLVMNVDEFAKITEDWWNRVGRHILRYSDLKSDGIVPTRQFKDLPGEMILKIMISYAGAHAWPALRNGEPWPPKKHTSDAGVKRKVKH